MVARTDICSAVLYKKGNSMDETEIVLVKEFRSPANNSECFIYEIPGGSSIKPEDNIDVIHDEIKEELGLDIDKNKLEYINSRQLAGTLSSHKSHLYKLELTEEEITKLKNDKSVHGVEEDTERTYIKVVTLKEILEKDLLDWTNIGMIMQVIKGEYL
jgi:8-oxo-dGTP pyrophosphatase MutT (NUDIX family)